MWENETKQIENNTSLQNKAYSLMLPQKNNDDNDKIILMQAMICVVVIIFVLFSKFAATPLYNEIKTQYQQIISSGIDISEQGELVRFVGGFAQGIREKVVEVFNSIDDGSAKGGAEKGNDIRFLSIDLPYRISVTPYIPVDDWKINSSYGMRKNPITNKNETHSGLDIKADYGDKVYASYGGQVEKCGNDNIRGNYVIIKHTNNLRTLYQHLSAIYINNNDRILRGQIIGAVGSTGLSTGAHLHYELIVDNVCVNPYKAFRCYK